MALWVNLCYHSSQNCSTPTATSASCSQTLSQPLLAPGIPTGTQGIPQRRSSALGKHLQCSVPKQGVPLGLQQKNPKEKGKEINV